MPDYSDLKCAYQPDGKVVAKSTTVFDTGTLTNLAVGTPEKFSGVGAFTTTGGVTVSDNISSSDLNSGDSKKFNPAFNAKANLKKCESKAPSV